MEGEFELNRDVVFDLATLKDAVDENNRVNVLLLKKEGADFVPFSGVGFRFEADTPRLTPARTKPGMENIVEVRLDRTGVATPSFLNTRWPVYLGPAEAKNQAGPSEEEWQRTAFIAFRNYVADRQFTVTFSGISDAHRWEFLDAGLQLSGCHEGKCDATILVPPGVDSPQRVPVHLLYGAYVKENHHAPVLSFGVKLFHDDAELANPQGFFSVVPYEYMDRKENETTWGASVSGQFGSTPDLTDLPLSPDDDPMITDAASRGRANDVKFKGTARVSLKQSLGDRANGEFELQLKKGDFGTDPKVSATKYRFNVNAIQGMKYSGGLYDIAEPSEGVALSESGENIGVHYWFVDLHHIFRKHVPKLKSDALDFEAREAARNHSATLLQVRNAPGLVWGHAQLDLYALYGRKHATRCLQLFDEKCPVKPTSSDATVVLTADGTKPATFDLFQSYTTTGLDLSFDFRQRWSGTAALYHSRLHARDLPANASSLSVDSGRGTVGVVTMTFTDVDLSSESSKARYSIHGQVGSGTGDDPGKDGNDGYLGETASFAPDELFLNLLAPAIHSEHGQVGGGLTNKTYAGGLFTTSRWSLLCSFAHGIQVPASDVDACSTTIKLHTYRFHQPVRERRYAGTELDLDFSIDSPAGVTYSFDLAGFWPGASLGGGGSSPVLIRGFQWTAFARVSVKM